MSYFASNYYASNYYASNYYAGVSAVVEPADIGFDGFSKFTFNISAESSIRLNRVGHISGINIDAANSFSVITSGIGLVSEMATGTGALSKIDLFDSDAFSKIEFNISAKSIIDTSGDSAVSGISVQPLNRFSIIVPHTGATSQITTGCGAISTITINVGGMSEIS